MSTATIPQIESETRTKLGSRYSLRLREAGRLPGVVYGHGQDPVHVSVDARSFADILHQSTHLVEISVDGKSEPCLIKDVQYDYLDTTPIHVDLARVNLDEEVEVDIEVELVGEPVGLKEDGAVLEHPLTTITVKCKANNIPDSIEHSVKELGVGDSVHVSDLVMPEGVVCETDGELLIAQVSVQAEIEEEEPEATGDEPEVIGAKDDEGEEDADD